MHLKTILKGAKEINAIEGLEIIKIEKLSKKLKDEV